MVTLFGIFETGTRGLFAQQAGLAVTGNNIANVNTPGYSRQRVNLVTTKDIDTLPKPIGMGVKVDSISRYRNAFLDAQIRKESSNLSFYQGLSNTYNQLETIFSDPINLPASSLEDTNEAGLNATLIRFFDALQELTLEPESSSVRYSVAETSVTLASTFNQISRQMQDLREDLNRQVTGAVSEINAILDSVLDINIEVARLELGQSANANNLRDQRDQLLARLSEYIPVKIVELPSGAINVEIFGTNAVQPSSVTHLQAIQRPGDSRQFVDIVFQAGSGQTLNSQLTSGRLGAALQGRDILVPGFQTQLDELAATLIHEVNKIHSGGSGLRYFNRIIGGEAVQDPTDLLSAARLPFAVQAGSLTIALRDSEGNVTNRYTVNVDPGTQSLNDLVAAIDAADGTAGGGNLSASLTLQNQLVIESAAGTTFTFEGDSSWVLAALRVNTFFDGTDASTLAVNQAILDNPALIAASSDGTSGNNQGALAMARLRTAQVLSEGTADFNEYYQSMIAQLGTQGRRVSQLESNTSLLVDSLWTRQEEVAGVSLDEETVNMLKYQRAFVAASRFITVIDEAIQTIVERMGIVGR